LGGSYVEIRDKNNDTQDVFKNVLKRLLKIVKLMKETKKNFYIEIRDKNNDTQDVFKNVLKRLLKIVKLMKETKRNLKESI